MKQPNMSKKEQRKISILLSVAVIISLVFVIFGQIKSNEVKALEEELIEVRLQSEKNAKEANAQAQIAVEMAASAEREKQNAIKQKQITQRTLLELQECQSK